MKTRTLVISLLVIAGLACGIAIQAVAQQGGGFGGGMQMPGALTQEQRTKINEAVQADMAALTAKLTEAQTAAVKAALAKDATEASVKAKIEAVGKIQTDIAILKFTKGIKAITLTDEQKTGMEASPAMAYNQLFGAGGGARGGMGGGMPGGMGGGGFGGGRGPGGN
jgi:Spy/CpxP family protein refolding chaperone